MEKILKNIKILWWLLPIFLIVIYILRCLLIKYANVTENDFNNYLSIFAVFFTFFGFYAAFYAQKNSESIQTKSDEIQKDLIEFGLINNPKESFEIIFKDDLIPSLSTAKNYANSKIYLLLSSPAYGYPVVTKDTYNSFKTELFNFDNSIIVELMFFCPDSHFDYWSNIILWDLSDDKNKDLSIFFAKEVFDVLNQIQSRKNHYKLYVKKEVSIRLYGFDYGNRGNQQNETTLKPDKVYLCMVDPFNIVMSQSEISKARHIQLPSRNISEYIGGIDKESLFERMKQCPYRMTKFEDAIVNPSFIPYLVVDYLFGLTSISRVVNDKCFLSEFDLFFKNYKKSPKFKNNSSTDIELIKEIVNNIIRYYCEIISFLENEYNYSNINKDISFLLSILKTISNLTSFSLDNYSNIKDVINSSPDYLIDSQPLENKLNSYTDDVMKFKMAVYFLLYSGLGKSLYYEKLTK